MSYCTSCGNPLTPGEKFCPNCGTAVSAAGSSGESQTSVGAGGGGSSSGAASMLPGSAGGDGGGKPNVALIVVLAVVAVLALGTIAVFLMRGSAGSQPAAQTSSLASAPTSTAPSPVVTVTATATPTPTVTVTSTPTPTPTVTVTHTEPAPAPVTNYQDCGSGVVAVGPTSCPFALSVADRFNASGGAYYLPNVYSPATGGTYDMYCDRSYYPVVCTGGNNAEVRIR